MERLGLAFDRRSLIKGAIGVGGALIAGSVIGDTVDAARRGYSGPSVPNANGATGWFVEVMTDPETVLVYQSSEQPGIPRGTIVFFNEIGYDMLLDIEGGPVDDSIAVFTSKSYQFTPPHTVRFRVKVVSSGNPTVFGPWDEVRLS
jgi:hypothetical protein